MITSGSRPVRDRRLIGTFLLALLAASCSRDPRPGTPAAAAEGDRLIRKMSDTLAQARTFEFETTEILEGLETTGKKRVFHFRRKVAVRRPNGLYIEIHGLGATKLEAAAYYDGKTLSLRGDAARVWAQAGVPGTLDEMLDDVARRFSLPIPIADVVYSSPYEAFLGNDAKGGFVGRETIDGERCAVLAYEDALVEVRLWIPTSGRDLPRRLKLTYKQMAGKPVSEMTYTRWNLDVPVDDGTFAFRPPSDYRRVPVEELVAGLGTGGEPPKALPVPAGQ